MNSSFITLAIIKDLGMFKYHTPIAMFLSVTGDNLFVVLLWFVSGLVVANGPICSLLFVRTLHPACLSCSWALVLMETDRLLWRPVTGVVNIIWWFHRC